MYTKGHQLSIIPEKNESEEEEIVSEAPQEKEKKFVSKNKHDVLKAKYKCLKKLFQVYDASIIGILPTAAETSYDQGERSLAEEPRKHSHRKKHVPRSKTDASSGTNEQLPGETPLTNQGSSIDSSTATPRRSCSTQFAPLLADSKSDNEMKSLEPSIITIMGENKPNFYPSAMVPITMPNMMPSMALDRPRRPTRFQSFICRLFGLRPGKTFVNPLTGHVHPASDNNIVHNYGDKRRRRGLRIRRIRKPKKIHSEFQLRDLSCPPILQYVQSVQRHCLLDRTPRQCPIPGCNNIFYGIINYNDHLNLCHFPERKYICHYCHEGFHNEYDKYVHENQHLGFTKIKPDTPEICTPLNRQNSAHRTSIVTQTEPSISNCNVPEEKLKKIVSFFDKIAENDQILTEFKKTRVSDTNIRSSDNESAVTSTDKRVVVSCANLRSKKNKENSSYSESTDSEICSKCPCSIVSSKCHSCGEEFDNRRLLNLHVELEHGNHAKFAKFHSCAGIIDGHRMHGLNDNVKSEAGKVDIRCNRTSLEHGDFTMTSAETCSEVSRDKSEVTLSYDPSTNIIFSDSLDTLKKQATNSCIDKSRHITAYRWEPGTKIIRV